MTPLEMTLDQCREWCAVDMLHHQLDALGSRARSEDYYRDPPPCPPTLDGAAAALPEGWKLRTLYQCDTGWVCSAMLNAGNIRGLVDQPDEITARYRLAVACRMKEKER